VSWCLREEISFCSARLARSGRSGLRRGIVKPPGRSRAEPQSYASSCLLPSGKALIPRNFTIMTTRSRLEVGRSSLKQFRYVDFRCCGQASMCR
jgi:hypothetical protein